MLIFIFTAIEITYSGVGRSRVGERKETSDKGIFWSDLLKIESILYAGKDDEDDKFSSERVYESINFQTCGFYKLISLIQDTFCEWIVNESDAFLSWVRHSFRIDQSLCSPHLYCRSKKLVVRWNGSITSSNLGYRTIYLPCILKIRRQTLSHPFLVS